MGLNLYDITIKATTKFAVPSKTEIRNPTRIPCPFCNKKDVALTGSNTLELHVYFGGYYICEASGKSPDKARLLQLDDHFNVINDDDI